MAAQDSNGPEANSSATTPLTQTDAAGSGVTTSNLNFGLYGNAGQQAGHLIGDREGWSAVPRALLWFVALIDW
jgi:hypothetical protein